MPFQSAHPCRVRSYLRRKVSQRNIGFNPRTRVGCDSQVSNCRPANRSFNPRTRVGCDTTLQRIAYYLGSFNPRTYERCDGLSGSCRSYDNVSIRAPTRGAINICSASSSGIMFQSAHLREVRCPRPLRMA